MDIVDERKDHKWPNIYYYNVGSSLNAQKAAGILNGQIGRLLALTAVDKEVKLSMPNRPEEIATYITEVRNKIKKL